MRSLHSDAGYQPVRNLCSDPRGLRAATPAVGDDVRLDFSRNPTETNDAVVTGASDGPPGTGITSYVRRRRTSTGSVSGRGYSLTAGNVSDATLALGSGARVTPGETITLYLFVRMESTAVDWRFFVRFALAGSTAWQAANNTSAQQTVQGGKWRMLVGQFVVPAGVDRFAAIAGMAAVTVGAESYDATGLLFVRGKFSAPYCDGASPMWKWDGVDGSSTSVGYPWTLGKVVSAPVVYFEGAFPSDIPIPAASQKRQGYTAYSVCTPGPGTTRTTLLDGTVATQRIHITYGDGGQRWNMYLGASAFSAIVNDGNTRRVLAVRLDAANSRFLRDGALSHTGNTGTTAANVQNLRVGANAAGADPWNGTIEAVLLFDQAHTDEQMSAVSKWLGARYIQAIAS